jgi:sec-independent protein translocase protein TatA
MFGLDAPELIIIAIVILVLFGSKKLPDAARALGRSMRIFKAETREMKADEQAAAIDAPAQPPVARPGPPPDQPSAAPVTPVTPEPPTTERQTGGVPYEPQAGSESR